MNISLYDVSVWVLPLLIAITFHEAAHGFVAWRLGDNTAWQLGRVSFNPLRHIDPFGTVILPGVLLLSHSPFLFGYAKPVPVNFRNLNHPRTDMVWVALAGPGANLAQAIGWTLALYLMIFLGVDERFFLEMGRAGVLVNLVMFAFNLFPVPPLDGGRILVGLLPWKQAQAVARIEPYGFFIVMALVIAGVVGSYWLRPLMSLGYTIIDLILYPFMALLR